MAPDLPIVSRCAVRLANPSQKAQLEQCMPAAFLPDGDAEHYISEMRQMYAQAEWRKGGRTCVWVLVYVDDLDGEGYCFAETHRRRVLIKRLGEDVSIGWDYAMGPVLTPKPYMRTPRLRTPPTKHTPLPPSRPIPPPTLPTILAAFTLIPRDILPIGLTSTLESLNTVPTGFYEKCYIGQGEDRRLGWVSPKEGERGGMNTDWYCSIPPSPPSDNPEPNVKLKVESESNVLEVEGQQYAPAYVYQSDFVTLGPILSVAFRTRLQTHPNPNQTTLISFDPGDKGWLDHFEDHSRHAASDLLRPSTDPAIPRGIRWYPKTRSSSAQIEKTDPIILFAPNAFHYTPKHLLITLTLNITPSFLPLVLNTLAKEGKKYGCDQIRAWGVDPTEPLGQRWKELGATVEDRFLTRENPWGVAWYGGDPGRGEYVRAEMWAFH